MQGFLIHDFMQRAPVTRDKIAMWIESGELKSLRDEVVGLENLPGAFVDILAGGNIGTRIVRINP